MSVPADRLPLNHRPWYREPWPWLLMAAPLAAIAMGVLMFVLANRSNDGLVADDYYKRGLAINQTLERVERARSMGISGAAAFNPERTRVRVVTQGVSADTLTLKFVHPTRAGLDQVIRLARVGGGVYEGAVQPLASGQWHLSLEDPAGAWRVTGSWPAGAVSATLEPDAGR